MFQLTKNREHITLVNDNLTASLKLDLILYSKFQLKYEVPYFPRSVHAYVIFWMCPTFLVFGYR